MMRDTGLSASDVALLSQRNDNGNGFGGFGGDGAWWIIILFLFVFCGWGNNGNGFGGGGSAATQGALTREQACIDNNFQNLMRETAGIADSVNLGFANLNSTICNQQYDTANLVNGVNQNISNLAFGLNSTLCQGFNGINVAMLQGNNALQSQIASCCCDIRSGLDNMNFNNAQNTCAITNAINNSTNAIIQNATENYRALHDEIVANRIEDKNAQIQAQQNEINKLQLAASQERQNAYLVSELGPKQPVPAYPVFPATSFAYPTGVSFGINGLNGYNNGCCGCGC